MSIYDISKQEVKKVDNPFKLGELVTGPISIKEPTFRKGDIIKRKFYYVSDINKNKIYLKDLKGEEVPGYFRPYQLRKVKPEDYIPILSQLEPAPNKTVGGSLLFSEQDRRSICFAQDRRSIYL
jgi:hypothetical protein